MSPWVPEAVSECLREYFGEGRRRREEVRGLAVEMIETRTPFGIYWGNKIRNALTPQSLSTTAKRDENGS